MRASRQRRAGPLSVLTGPLEAGSRELGAGSQELGAGSRDRTGSREAREIRVLNHWAAGLRSRLLAEGCGVATPESAQKNGPKSGSLERKIDFGPHEMRFQVV